MSWAEQMQETISERELIASASGQECLSCQELRPMTEINDDGDCMDCSGRTEELRQFAQDMRSCGQVTDEELQAVFEELDALSEGVEFTEFRFID